MGKREKNERPPELEERLRKATEEARRTGKFVQVFPEAGPVVDDDDDEAPQPREPPPR